MKFIQRLFARSRERSCPQEVASPPTTVPQSPNLAQYKANVAALPSPTLVQMQQFAEFISHAHSWYKGLALFPPGTAIQVFLDPAGGMQLERSSEGDVEALPRTEWGFHYSLLPTNEYRERFGYLGFSRTSIAKAWRDGNLHIGSDGCYYDPNLRQLQHLPPEVLEAGRAFISGIIHTLGANPWLFMIHSRNVPPDFPRDTLAQIRKRCSELEEDPTKTERLELSDLRASKDFCLTQVDYPLYQILEPERQRQRTGLVNAMTRVIDIVGTGGA